MSVVPVAAVSGSNGGSCCRPDRLLPTRMLRAVKAAALLPLTAATAAAVGDVGDAGVVVDAAVCSKSSS